MLELGETVAQEAKLTGRAHYDDLWDRPGYLVRRLHQIHLGLFAEECGQNLTAVQYAVLTMLCDGEEYDQLTLSRAVGIDRTSGADVIKRLVRRGLVVRETSLRDRRAKIVRINDAGRAFVKEMRPAMERAQDRFVEPLSADERARFMQYMRRLIRANNDASRAPMA